MHLNAVKKQLFTCDKSDNLRMLMHRYENEISNLNTYAVRQCLGKSFLVNVKRDALEFLTSCV